MMSKKVLLERSLPLPEATERFAREVYDHFLKPEKNWTVFLYGGLGVGKTVFTRALLHHMGHEEEVVSPTYTYVQEYETDGGVAPNHTVRGTIAHFDLYRTKPEDFYAKGFVELASDPGIHCIVEWPERLPEGGKKDFSGTAFFIELKHGKAATQRSAKVTSWGN